MHAVDICALPQQRRPNTCKNVIKMTREIHVAELIYKLCLHNHGYFVHEPFSRNRSGKVGRLTAVQRTGHLSHLL